MSFLNDATDWITGQPTANQAAEQSANLQSQAAQNSLALQQQQFDYARQIQDPYVQGGQLNYQNLMQQMAPGGQYSNGFGLNQFYNSPTYQLGQAALGATNQGIAAQAAAAGNFGSPATQNAIAQADQSQLGQQYQQAQGNWLTNFNMLAGQASPNAAQQVANQGMNYAQNAGNTMTNAAQNMGNTLSQAAQYSNSQQANGLNDLGALGSNFASMYSQMNNPGLISGYNNQWGANSGLNQNELNQGFFTTDSGQQVSTGF